MASVTPQAPLNALERNAYDTTSLTYPIDLETLAHLVQFNIYVPTTATQGAGIQGSSVTTAGITGVPGDAAGGSSPTQLQNTQLTNSQKITTSVQLYTPGLMQFDNSQDWNQTEITPLLRGVGAGLAELIGPEALATVGIVAGASALSGNKSARDYATYAAGIFATGSDLGKAASYGQFGYSVNPVVQVIYSAPKLRSFQFDFDFAPRSQAEAEEARLIIQTFRGYSSPDYSAVGNAGILGNFFIPPATFDITFMMNMNGSFTENTKIPKISRCALTQVLVNHAPDGKWVTGPDGYPVHTQMQLFFTELQIMTNYLIQQQGF